MAKINLLEYQDWVYKPWLRDEDPHINYNRIKDGMVEEMGEIFGKLKKSARDGWTSDKLRAELELEVGDLMFYLAMFCNWYDIDLDTALVKNVDKLEARMEAKTIQGEGDYR
jgi:NTP pyrophosphatase (non-canonical NTP hydrolase)